MKERIPFDLWIYHCIFLNMFPCQFRRRIRYDSFGNLDRGLLLSARVGLFNLIREELTEPTDPQHLISPGPTTDKLVIRWSKYSKIGI